MGTQVAVIALQIDNVRGYLRHKISSLPSSLAGKYVDCIVLYTHVESGAQY